MTRKAIFILPVILFLTFELKSQQTTNVLRLKALSKELLNDWKIKQQKVKSYTETRNIPIRQELEDGRVIQMVDIIDGIPQYYTTFNYGAAQTTRATELWEGGSSGLNITGDGYDKLGEWDAGHIRTSHQEFTNQGDSRVTNMDGESPTHYHSTHVAGTLVAAGVEQSAQGMAYKGSLKAWDWNGDGGEMAAAAADGLEISNHSYGEVRGWDYDGGWVWHGNEIIDENEDYNFGFYDGSARSYDLIAFDAPYYLIVKSAGNDRGQGPGNAGQDGVPEKDGGTDGYDCLGGGAVAKDIMTVGAVRQVTNYTGPESVVMSSFSSWGPADDGRIKPDIVGKGVDVFSTLDGNDQDYASLSGTSMASPNVAGSMALLQQYYQNTHDGNPMLASTLKGLVIHTADEAGPYDGPDYKFGWGLMNTLRASEVISADVSNDDIIEEQILESGEIFTKQIDVPDSADLKITLCWTDPAAIPLPFELNPRTPMLVNDLDLLLLDNNFNEIYPYSLDPDNPSAPPTTDGKNNTDNVEMIHLKNANAGNYTVLVLHDGYLENGEQAFSLIITGMQQNEALPGCSADLINPQNGASEVLLNQYVSWQPADFASSYDVYFGTDGGGTQTPANIFNGENIEENGFNYLMDPSETYYLQVIPRNNHGTAEGCDQIWSFSTMNAISDYPYSQDMTVPNLPDLPQYWQSADMSDAIWHTTDIDAHSQDDALLCSMVDSFNETSFDNWLISPPFFVESDKEYKVKFYYKNAVDGVPENIKLYTGKTPLKNDLNNLIFQGDVNNVTEWKSDSVLIQADEDGLLFLGFYTDNPQGHGLYLDDFSIDYWGPNDVHSSDAENVPMVYYSSGKLYVKPVNLNGEMNLTVFNQLGQVVYHSEASGDLEIPIKEFTSTGIHIVRLKSGDQIFTRKILVR